MKFSTSYSTKSTILNNFVNLRASQNSVLVLYQRFLAGNCRGRELSRELS